MLTFARIRMLVKRRSIEERKTVRVFRKMRGYPVDDYADSGLMAAINEVHEIMRMAEPGRRRIIAGDLIAPRPGERMFHWWHQLQMRVSEIFRIADQFFRQLAIAQEGIVWTAQP